MNYTYHILRNVKNRYWQRWDLRQWRQDGCPLPPPHLFKQQVIRKYAHDHSLRTFVETGTYLGDMVEAMRGCFDKIYSIEVGADLYRRALKRFHKASNVELWHGDSGVLLGPIIQELRAPALFWLDGHYSGGITARGCTDTPIIAEISHILSCPTRAHVLLIDDARCFGTDKSYPSLDELVACVAGKRGGLDVSVVDDIIRIVPK